MWSGTVRAVVDRLGIEVTSEVGDELNAKCPLHRVRTGREDRSPSWGINALTGAHKCFSCGFSGGLTGLVASMLGMTNAFGGPDFSAADRWIASEVRAAPKDLSGVSHAVRALPAYRTASRVAPMTEARLAVYSAPPPDALADRRITADAAAAYGVLWSPDAESWVLPIRDPYDGTLWGWQEKGHRSRHFRNRPVGVTKSLTLFSAGTVEPGGRMVVVESPLDAVRLLSAGVEGGVAAFGATLSDAQIRLLSAADEVIVAMDRDDAGMASAKHLLRTASSHGLEVRFLDYSGTRAKDVGDMTDSEIIDAVSGSKHMVRGLRSLR